MSIRQDWSPRDQNRLRPEGRRHRTRPERKTPDQTWRTDRSVTCYGTYGERCPSVNWKRRQASPTPTCPSSSGATNGRAPRVLSRLAAYHNVPLDELLDAAGYPQPNDDGKDTIADIQRSFRFLTEDPELGELQKPSEAVPIELKRFAIQVYEHYTGRKLLDRRAPAWTT